MFISRLFEFYSGLLVIHALDGVMYFPLLVLLYYEFGRWVSGYVVHFCLGAGQIDGQIKTIICNHLSINLQTKQK